MVLLSAMKGNGVMSNILLLSSKYSGTASANGICARNIVNELQSFGHKVAVLCYENDLDEENVYRILKKKVEKRSSPFSRWINLLNSLFRPDIDDDAAEKYTEQTIELCRKNEIDIVVCFFFPLETVSVLKEVKKAFPQIKTVIYELDSVGDGIFASLKMRFFAIRAYEKWITSNYYYADRIIVMKGHELYWKKVWGKIFSDKLRIADIPVLTNRFMNNYTNSNKGTVTFLYGGVLDKKYRSPLYLLKILDALSMDFPLCMKFYSRGNCEELIADYCKKNDIFMQCGYVPQEVIEKEIFDSDVLVSIGNKASNSLPSKVITYLSYGKPILHVSSRRDDICIKYLNKSPISIVIYEDDPIQLSIERLKSFMSLIDKKEVQYSDLSKIFVMNTPLYSAELIDGIAQNFE